MFRSAPRSSRSDTSHQHASAPSRAEFVRSHPEGTLVEPPHARTMSKVVMVTGGTGLVGSGIQEAIAAEGDAAKDEKWIYLSSKDGNLCDPAAALRGLDGRRRRPPLPRAARQDPRRGRAPRRPPRRLPLAPRQARDPAQRGTHAPHHPPALARPRGRRGLRRGADLPRRPRGPPRLRPGRRRALGRRV